MPKILAPVGIPLLAYQLRYLSQQGVDEVAINTHHFSRQVHDFIDDGGWQEFVDEPIDVHLFQEPRLLGTAGALLPMADFVGEKPFYVVYGDVLSDIPIWELGLNYLVRSEANVAVIGCYMDKSEGKSLLEIGRSGRIKTFTEKPAKGKYGIVNAGCYVLPPQILGEIRTGDDFGNDVFPRLLGKEWAMFGRMFDKATVIDVGTMESLSAAEEFITSMLERR